jgi:hypothetical protein
MQGTEVVAPWGAVSEQLTLVMAASITAMDTGAAATRARAGSDANITPHATRATNRLWVMDSDIGTPSADERKSLGPYMPHGIDRHQPAQRRRRRTAQLSGKGSLT